MTKNIFKIKKRKCKKSEYDFVYRLMKTTLFPLIAKYQPIDKKKFDEKFFKDYAKMTILLRGKRRIGLYEIEEKQNHLYVSRIFLTPFYQGKGIGAQIMESFETLGYQKITLEVWENNPAVSFYKKLGYVVTKKQGHKYFLEKRIVK